MEAAYVTVRCMTLFIVVKNILATDVSLLFLLRKKKCIIGQYQALMIIIQKFALEGLKIINFLMKNV